MRDAFVRVLSVLVVGLVSCLTVFGATISGHNFTTINIPWLGSGPLQADPYPSPITIAGVVNPITSVTVDLFGYNHTFSSDTDILLVGPTGLNLLMMSDAGSSDQGSVNLTFSDAAAGLLPHGLFVSGTYMPTDYTDESGDDVFASPAPAGPYGTTLSVFNGSNANGIWKLYVMDDNHLDKGSITGGWQLNISDDQVGVPEPSTVALVLAGMAAAIAGRRRLQ